MWDSSILPKERPDRLAARPTARESTLEFSSLQGVEEGAMVNEDHLARLKQGVRKPGMDGEKKHPQKGY